MTAVQPQPPSLDRRQGGLRQRHPVEVWHLLQRRRAKTGKLGERRRDADQCRRRVVIDFDREAWRFGLEQRDRQGFRLDQFAQEAGGGAPRVGICGLDAELEKWHARSRLRRPARADPDVVILVSGAARKWHRLGGRNSDFLATCWPCRWRGPFAPARAWDLSGVGQQAL